MEKRLIVSLVTWNSAVYLEPLLKSLAAQTEKNIELLVTDNASEDDTVLRLSELLPSLPFPATFFRKEDNTGFAAAHNHHIREAIRRKARFIMIVNPDCILEPHACAMLLQALIANDTLGSVGGKILRAHFTTRDGVTVLEKLPTIDSTGLIMTRFGQWKERGAGEEDHGQYIEGNVMGISGAFVLYRMRALIETAITIGGKREFFDEDFFSYKEDVDLAWRLHTYGWSSWYTPHAIAWHHRTFGRNRRHLVSPRLRALSWRNNLLLLLKNYRVPFSFEPILIFFRECAKFLWILFREPRTLQLFPSIFFLWFPMMRKRLWIIQHRQNNRSSLSSS